MLTKVAAEGKAIITGHHDIQNDQVNRVLSQLPLQRIAAIRKQYAQAMLLQIAADQIADVSVVIDHQDCGRVAHSLLR